MTGCGVILLNNESRASPTSVGARFSALGVITFLLSFFGCCGAIKDNVKFLFCVSLFHVHFFRNVSFLVLFVCLSCCDGVGAFSIRLFNLVEDLFRKWKTAAKFMYITSLRYHKIRLPVCINVVIKTES